MDIKPTVTFYPLKMLDGLFHIFKRTERPALIITEDAEIDPFDDYVQANEIVSYLNERNEDADLPDTQIT